MKKIWNKIRDIFDTFNMSVLLSFNLFFIAFLVLGVATLIVWLGIDGGFIFSDGHVTFSGGLIVLYAVCMVVTASIVVMIRLLFLQPIRQMMDAMKDLAKGDFSRRVEISKDSQVPREIREFADSFNRTAEELSGTELLRKDFVNNFSHEFKTPIVSIQGFADLLLEEELPEEDRKEYLTIIRDESHRLADLASNILSLNRVESQTILTDHETVRLDEQIRQSVLVTQQKWKEKDLDFRVDVQPLEMKGSESLLQQVWLNLLDNAAKFSPDQGVVSVTLRNTGEAIEAAVTDQGPGMDAQTVSHIFEQFYQGDTSHKMQGNGLGLAMVKKIVSLHGGEVFVNTEAGHGSSFVVRLPLEKEEKEK